MLRPAVRAHAGVKVSWVVGAVVSTVKSTEAGCPATPALLVPSTLKVYRPSARSGYDLRTHQVSVGAGGI
jgi:hypothetical protein